MKKILCVCFALNAAAAPLYADNILNPAVPPNPDMPVFKNGKLFIPRVDTLDVLGQYVDATLSPLPNGSWQLDSYKQAEKNYHHLPVESVELISVEGTPKQVFLRVRGWVGGCSSVGQIYTRLDEQTFKVTLNDGFDRALAPVVLCTADVRSFTRDIPLAVFGLKAGNYRYSVNNQLAGNFSLSRDNVLPPPNELVACTMDAKICPDGSHVGRTQPNCEFAPCPGQ